jgi:hypothetical protein
MVSSGHCFVFEWLILVSSHYLFTEFGFFWSLNAFELVK